MDYMHSSSKWFLEVKALMSSISVCVALFSMAISKTRFLYMCMCEVLLAFRDFFYIHL